MAAGTTLTTAAIEPPAGSESNLKITGTITTSNIVANTGDNLLVSSNLEVGTSNLFVDTATGRVGIGVASPIRRLDVRSGDTGSTNWISGAFGPELSAGDRVVIGNLYGKACIGAHNSALTGWADLTINSAGGNVGIGTTSPTNTLDINEVGTTRTGTHATGRPLYVTGDIGEASDGFEIRHSNGTQGIGFGYNSIYAAGTTTNQNINIIPKGSSRVRISNSGNLTNYIDIASYMNNGSTRSISGLHFLANPQFYNGDNGQRSAAFIRSGFYNSFWDSYISFITRTQSSNGGEVETLTCKSGKVGIGVASPSYQLQLSLNSAAKPTSSTWIISSDKRIKENIVDANLDTCYENVKNLKLKYYKLRDDIIELDPMFKDAHKLGWIAQEVEEVLPKCVTTIPEQYGLTDVKNLDSDQLYTNLFGAVQKLIKENENLKARIEALENSS
jgi:hypothetical protein